MSIQSAKFSNPEADFPLSPFFPLHFIPSVLLVFHSHQLVPNLRSWQILEEQQTNQKYKNNALTNS